MDQIKGFWVDENLNKWNASTYDEATAKEMSDSLINCKRCINCKNCRDCVWCIDCIDCTDCQVCKKCDKSCKCQYCNFCSGCEHCTFCICCRDLFGEHKNVMNIKRNDEYEKIY